MFKWLGAECLKRITYEWGGIEAPLCLEIPIYNVPLLPILQHGSNSAKVVVGFSFGSLRLTIYLQRSGARGPIWKVPNLRCYLIFNYKIRKGDHVSMQCHQRKHLVNAWIVNIAVKQPTEMQIIPWLVEYHNSDEAPISPLAIYGYLVHLFLCFVKFYLIYICRVRKKANVP